MKNGLLLHNCCAPCSVSAVRNLKAEFDLQGFWFNPNIHPAEENIKRRDSVAALAAKNNFALNFGPEYSEARWTETACMPGTRQVQVLLFAEDERNCKKGKVAWFGAFHDIAAFEPVPEARYDKRDCCPGCAFGRCAILLQGLQAFLL